MSEWQPIETAPMDGRQLILHEPREWWGQDDKEVIGYTFTGYYAFWKGDWHCSEYDAFERYPTHWMPLPEPPK